MTQLTLFVPLLVFLVVLFVVVAMMTPHRLAIRARLNAYAMPYEPGGFEARLALPFFDRVISPVLQNLASLMSRVAPDTLAQQTAKRLRQAGQPQRLSVGTFFAMKLVLAVLVPFLYGLQLQSGGEVELVQIVVLLTLIYIGFKAPDLWLDSKINERRAVIAQVLPDALDLIVVCVEAGLSFEAALGRVVERDTGPLAGEVKRALAEMSMGKRRRDALRDMADRCQVTELSSFVAMIVQADQTGVSIADVLRVQADALRVKRQQRAQEEGQKAPLKMLFPLIFFILPATFVVILGPAALAVMDNFLGLSSR